MTKIKPKISWRDATLVAVIALLMLLSGILLVGYIDAWFLVLVGWILVPVFVKKAYDRVSERKKK
jgi:uncharacterized membrane protein